jgi:hypothetical protein
MSGEGFIRVNSGTNGTKRGATGSFKMRKGAQTAVSPNGDPSGETEENHVGRVLRTAYQSMVEESIPDEMLDLLNRLG